MRDDVGGLLTRLLELYRNKKDLLRTLRLDEGDKRYFLKSGDTERLLESFERERPFFASIDEIDMKISSIRRDLCAILGVDESGFHATLVSIDEPLVDELLSEISDISLCIREIMREHATLFEKMKELLESIKSEHDSVIRHLRHVKKNLGES